MALSPKPVRPAPKPVEPEAVASFLSRGGSAPETVAAETASAAGKGAQHPLKFPAGSGLFERLEQARSASMVKLPRNTWILQAIAEKLERDAG